MKKFEPRIQPRGIEMTQDASDAVITEVNEILLKAVFWFFRVSFIQLDGETRYSKKQTDIIVRIFDELSPETQDEVKDSIARDFLKECGGRMDGWELFQQDDLFIEPSWVAEAKHRALARYGVLMEYPGSKIESNAV